MASAPSTDPPQAAALAQASGLPKEPPGALFDPPSADYVIDVQNLTKSFGGKVVVNSLSMRVKRGEIFGFLGPNGSGKTTFIRMLCGLLKADSGSGTCLGLDVFTQADLIKPSVGYMSQRFSLYEDLRSGRLGPDIVPRTVIFGGKAAPGYRMAKLIIRLIHAVSDAVSREPKAAGLLTVAFLSNYCVSNAEKIIPGTELSEQISLAGTEASGTGNMKFSINGALTIGTLDGANVEIRERVGAENFFLFGNTTPEVNALKARGYNPWEFYQKDETLHRVLDLIASGHFSPMQPDLFRPIVDSLLGDGDRWMLLADFRSYIDAQKQVSRLYRDQDLWLKKSILNTAGMGYFSSDRAIAEYARDIWGVKL